MEAIFRTKDGKEFDDEYAAMDHEWVLDHPKFTKILAAYSHESDIYDIEDLFIEAVYEAVDQIFLPDESVSALQEFVNKTGYLSFGSIDSGGYWIFNKKEGVFQKVSR